MREQGLDFRAKDQFAILEGIKQGLYAAAVAAEQQAPSPLIPNGKGENAVQARADRVAPAYVALQDDLRIACGFKAPAQRFQFRAQLVRIVDFAVVDDGELRALIALDHGLPSQRQIAYGQARMAQAGVAV